MSLFQDIHITKEFLDEHNDAFFVYGDNALRQGLGGAAKLRHHPRAIGFVTKKAPTHDQTACYRVEEYTKPFFDQLAQLEDHVKKNPSMIFYVSRLGAGLANRHYIWEKLIKHNLVETLKDYSNVVFCWNDEIEEPKKEETHE
jgi:hypothetical protein